MEKYSPKSGKTLIEVTVAALAAAIILGGCSGGCGIPHLSRDTYSTTVTEKVIKRKGTAKTVRDTYMVFTKNENGKVRVFENSDSPLEWKWNSSDIQAELEVGKRYDIKAYGWRIPLFSAYENIIDVKPSTK